jgi:hypothetical protein
VQYLIKIVSLPCLFLAAVTSATASTATLNTAELVSNNNGSTSQVSDSDPLQAIKKSMGITYFTFFYGPGIQPDSFTFSPNQLGEAEKHGLYSQNNVSFRYKFSSNLALDLQTRFNIFFTNYTGVAGFSPFVWESPRIGVSGKLLKGEDWSITGAINTDFPYFLPAPFSGFEVQQRTVLFNPGLFANFTYEPKNSKWSIFSVLAPRMFFYQDRTAAEPSYMKGGYNPQNKPELIIALQPTVSYQVSETLGISVGAKIDYRKHVLSDWNPFNADLASNGTNPAWRLAPMSVFLGVTYKPSRAFTIFPFIATYPIGAQRVDTRTGEQATLLSTTSVGMWIRGTLF